jgi:hypothetical protein
MSRRISRLDTAVHEFRLRDGPVNLVRLFYLDRGQTVKDFQEFATLVGQIAEIRRMYPINGTKILAMRGTADQISMADYFANELEKSAGAPHPHSMTSEYLLPASPRPNENVTRILFVANSPTIQNFQELATLIRSITEIRRVFTYNTPKAIAIRGTTDQVAFAEWLFNEIDQPRNGESSHASVPYNYPDSTTTENASSVRVFYLPHTTTVQDFQQIADTIRTATGVRRLFTYTSAHALALRATLDQVEQAQRLLTQLDPADFPMAR